LSLLRWILSTGLIFLSLTSASASEWIDWRWRSLDQPCNGDCGVAVYGGPLVDTAMTRIFLTKGIPPWGWDYGKGGIVAGTASRKLVTLFGVFDLEPEIGVGQRFGSMRETELWAAIYVRFTGFPWNNYLYTTVAVSTGLTYASGISAEETRRADVRVAPPGARLLHYFSPEITFALPEHRELELLFRFHHRSGAYCALSCFTGGAHYGTVGLRYRF